MRDEMPEEEPVSEHPGRRWATDFWHLSPTLIERLDALAIEERVGSAGGTVLEFSERPEALYVVREGTYTAWRRPEEGTIAEIFSLPPGVTFGDPCLQSLPGMPRGGLEDQSRIVAPPRGVHWRLPLDGLRRLLESDLDDEDRASLLDCFRDMRRVYLATPRIVARLSEHPLFRGLPRRWMAALLEGARILGVGDGREPIEIPPERRPVLVALEGQAWLRAADDPATRSRPLWPNADSVIDTGEHATALRLDAIDRAWVLAIPTPLLERAASSDLGFRRHALRVTSPDSPRGRGLREVDARDVEVVALACLDPAQTALDVGVLACEVAEHARREFGDRVRVVGLVPRGSTEEGPWDERLDFEQAADRRQPWEGTDLVILDASRLDPRRTDALEHADHVYRLDTSGAPTSASGDERIVRLLRPGASRPSQPESEFDGPLRGDARPSVRLVAADTDSGVDARSVGRLARAFTHRSVGLALGGGGALGWAHLPVIAALRGNDVPIDYVSGTSFGAVVAAFYCADPDRGLAKLEASSDRLFRLALKSVLSSRALGRFIEDELGDLRLDELPIAFFPVSTSALDLSPALPTHCSLSLAVRASGALPPMFSPVRWREPDGEVTRLLDGAFVANVPAEILRNAEVALIISSDTIPRPHLQDPKRQRLGMVDRFVDLWRGSERVIHDLSSRSARAGEVRFEASLPMIWAVNFRKRKRIEQKAREALEASLFPQRARDAWQMLAKGALRPTEGSSD